MVSTFAGSTNGGFNDGPATLAGFNGPTDLTIDAMGNIYVADAGNNEIRVISNSPMITVNSATICATGSAVLSAFGAVSYTWTPSIGLSANTGSMSYANPPSTIVYTITGSSASGTATATSTVTVLAASLTPSVTTNDVLCNGLCNGSTFVNVSGGTPPYHYSWSSGDTIPLVNNLCAGSYSVSIFDAMGCNAFSTAAINQPPPLIATLVASPDTVCPGGSTLISASVSGGTPGYLYNLQPSNSNTSNTIVSPTAATVYTINVMDANNCTVTTSTPVLMRIPDNIIGTISDTGTNHLISSGLVYLYTQERTADSAMASTNITATGTYTFNAVPPAITLGGA